MARLLVLVATIGAALANPEHARSKMILKNTGNEDLALYFMGSIDDGDMSMWDGSETLNAIVEPGGATARYVRFNDSFAIRSGDMQWRTRLSLYRNDHDAQPYKISFHNVMVEEEPSPIELKHHDEGYIWIDPNNHVTHSAVGGHEFSLRDKDSAERLAVSIHELDATELGEP